MSAPSNVPSSIGLPSGAPTSFQAVAAYLTQLGQALLGWIGLAANRINAATTWTAAPPHDTSSGTAGQFASDGTYLYVCTGTNTWKRVAVGGSW